MLQTKAVSMFYNGAYEKTAERGIQDIDSHGIRRIYVGDLFLAEIVPRGQTQLESSRQLEVSHDREGDGVSQVVIEGIVEVVFKSGTQGESSRPFIRETCTNPPREISRECGAPADEI